MGAAVVGVAVELLGLHQEVRGGQAQLPGAGPADDGPGHPRGPPRGSHEQPDLLLVPVRADEVVAERVAVWTPLAEELGVTITTWSAEPVTVMALPGALDQIIDNYLDNAIAVAPTDT